MAAGHPPADPAQASLALVRLACDLRPPREGAALVPEGPQSQCADRDEERDRDPPHDAHAARVALAASQGNTPAAVASLERAVALQDALVYMEPPPFYFPTRQALGAVLLEGGRPKQAEAVYRRDLDEWPKNGWSLFGLSRALEAQKKTDEAGWAEQGFTRAWARADVKLTASRF